MNKCIHCGTRISWLSTTGVCEACQNKLRLKAEEEQRQIKANNEEQRRLSQIREIPSILQEQGVPKFASALLDRNVVNAAFVFWIRSEQMGEWLDRVVGGSVATFLLSGGSAAFSGLKTRSFGIVTVVDSFFIYAQAGTTIGDSYNFKNLADPPPSITVPIPKLDIEFKSSEPDTALLSIKGEQELSFLALNSTFTDHAIFGFLRDNLQQAKEVAEAVQIARMRQQTHCPEPTSGDVFGSIAHKPEWQARLVDIIRAGMTQKNTPLFGVPDIPPSKLTNAVKACQVPVGEKALGLCDLTVFGSGKNAIVFTDRAIYFRSTLTKARIAYEEVGNVFFHKLIDGSHLVDIGNGKTIGLCFSGPIERIVLRTMNEIRDAALAATSKKQ